MVAWVKGVTPTCSSPAPLSTPAVTATLVLTSLWEVKTQLGIPVLTGMYEENPGADLKDKILITPPCWRAGMRKAAPTMAKLALKLMKGETLGASCEEATCPTASV